MGMDPYLLTPGPLTTSLTTKKAMLHDWGTRDSHFHDLTSKIRTFLVNLIKGQDNFVCIPMQGSGTFAVEAAIGTLIPKTGKLLIPNNGAYCQRVIEICEYLNRAYDEISFQENMPMCPQRIRQHLIENPDITHVVVVHCETSSGIMNPLKEISQVVAELDRKLIIDAMSTFGAIPIHSNEIIFDAIVASANKCLEGIPGLGFVIANHSTLQTSEGNSHSLSLDLYKQYTYMEKTKQWRFTPPTHVTAGFWQAIQEYIEEGGLEGRLARYENNCNVLVTGMRELGFSTLLDNSIMSPIIVTFHMPPDKNFNFTTFYDKLKQQGFIIYPGKLTIADTFRIGCIGKISQKEIKILLSNIRVIINEMNIQQFSPVLDNIS